MGNAHLPIAILGAGSWGTALALYLARMGQNVRLWSFEPNHVKAMQNDRSNERYLPGQVFPDSLVPMAEFADVMNGVKDILIAVPSIGFRDTINSIKPYLKESSRLISVTKGLDLKTGQLLHEVVQEIVGPQFPFAALSGPSFAKEVAKGLPTAVVIATQDKDFAQALLLRFNSQLLRIYLTNDVIGVEIGGVVKNVIAIATGISDGMGFGSNARCALITRGLAEMTRLGLALGAHTETFTGLAGLGDLVLTCTDNQSRNRRFGLALGQGKNAQAAEKEIGQVVEGKRNTELVLQLAKAHSCEMPIAQSVWEVFEGRLTALEAMKGLLSREPRKE